jgi:hypothetical protein
LPWSSCRTWTTAHDWNLSSRGNGLIMSSALPCSQRTWSSPNIWNLRLASCASKCKGEQVTLSVPDHREVAKGTLRSLIRTAGITLQEFVSGMRWTSELTSRGSGKLAIRGRI